MVSAYQNPFDMGVSAYQDRFDMGATKNDVMIMQKVLQAIAKLSKDPQLAYTLAPNWADGLVGPGTTKAVNLAVRKRIGKPPITAATVKKYVLNITETGLQIVKRLQAKAPPPPPPKPPEQRAAEKREERKALATVQKRDEKVLEKTKITSGIIPITSDSYLKFYPGSVAKKQAPGYGIYKKMPNQNPTQIGTVLVIEPLRKLKITAPRVSATTAIEIRRRVPKPWNTYSITLNGKQVSGRTTQNIKNPPPPVSPHVPPEAPPDAVSTDYSTPKTPKVVQKDVAEKQPPPKEVAPPTAPPDPQSGTPEVKKDPKTGRRVIKMPPVTITAEPPRKAGDPKTRELQTTTPGLATIVLPNVPEDEAFLEQFFEQDMIAGLRMLGIELPEMPGPRKPSKLPEFTYDTRYGMISPHHYWKRPKDVEILAGFDGFDDSDEELAEMQASGFSKGWW